MGQASSTTDTDNKKPDNTWWYVGIGVGVFSVLCLCVVIIVFMMGGSGDSSSNFESHGSSFPEYLIIEHRYGDNVNPYNNLAFPPLPPPKPDTFGDPSAYR